MLEKVSSSFRLAARFVIWVIQVAELGVSFDLQRDWKLNQGFEEKQVV